MSDKDKKPIVLVFVAYYLPGYKAGGPLRTIHNIVEHLGDEFEFRIVTGDRDLGDDMPYASIEQNVWQTLGKAKVYYVSPERSTVRQFAKIIADTDHDVLYLNSFFSPNFTIKPLLACKFYGASQQSIIVAPRGEFSLGALALKKRKKRLYIWSSFFLGLYKGVVFQASSRYELADIRKALHISENCIKIAGNLPALEKEKGSMRKVYCSKELKITFLSRISPMKNLGFALKILKSVTQTVQFDIYGPREDENYWSECQKLIKVLPKNVTVKYCGSLLPDEVKPMFVQYDLFLFPTLGENYGHVIAESLCVGTPVLLSDQTPWRNLEEDSIGWDYSLLNVVSFVQAIESYAKLSADKRMRLREQVVKNSYKRIYNPVNIELNRLLFLSEANTN